MTKFGRNDPCPCGSGIKFKNCHLGREEELVVANLGALPEDAGEKITALPPVSYGRCHEFLDGLDLHHLVQSDVHVKFIDLESYLKLGFVPKNVPDNLSDFSAGQMVNPIKTMKADPDHIYLAVTPAVSDSTVIHQLAHVLDFLGGSKINPGLAGPLSMELEVPSEFLEHPKEFGEWLDFLRNRFNVDLDAEDAIVWFLYEKGYLIPGPIILSDDQDQLTGMIKRSLTFLREHRNELDELIRNRTGYLEDQA